MNKYNNKQETGSEVIGVMIVIFCIMILVNYITM